IRTIPGQVLRNDGVQEFDLCAVITADTATTIERDILANRALRNVDLCVRTVIEDSAATTGCSVTVQRTVDDVEGVRSGVNSAAISTASAWSSTIVVERATDDVECS